MSDPFPPGQIDFRIKCSKRISNKMHISSQSKLAFTSDGHCAIDCISNEQSIGIDNRFNSSAVVSGAKDCPIFVVIIDKVFGKVANN